MLVQREQRFPSGREFLDASAQQRRAGGLLGPPSPQRRQPPSLLDAQPSGPGAGGGGLPASEPVQAPGQPQAGPLQSQQPGAPAGQQQPDGSRRREPGPGEQGQSFLSRLFAGDLTTGERQALTSEDRDRLLRQGLITMGLGMLGSNAPGTPFGEVLARGIFAARQDVQQTAGALLDERNAQVRLARRAQVFENPDLSPLEKWREIRRISATEGDTEAVKVASDIVKRLEDLEAGEAESEIRDVNGQPLQFVEHSDGSVTVKNPFTGEVVRETPAAPEDEGERLSRINSLADDFRTEANGLIEAQRFAENAQGAPATAAGDQTLVVTLNKLLDPNSVIRQSEFDRVAQIGGFTGQAQQFANRILSEGELGEQARQSIRQEIDRLRRANAQELQSIQEHYRRRAQDADVDPRLVFRSVVSGPMGGQQGGGSGVGGSGTGAGGSGGAPTLFPEDEGGN